MNIGQASKESGISAKMIRYYEQIGLIPKVERKKSGYRDYSLSDIHRLNFIRRARLLGFPVAEINTLLTLWQDQSRQSANVKNIAQAHILQLQDRIKQLQEMTATLEKLVKCCAGNDRPECPILTNLEHSSDDVAARTKRPQKPKDSLRHHE